VSLEILRPGGALVKHAFSGIGKRTFPSCMDVCLRFRTLSGFLERIGSFDSSGPPLEILYFEDIVRSTAVSVETLIA